MSIHVALNPVTHSRYDRPVHLGPQVVRLRPAPHSRTRILSYSMKVDPAEHFINWQQDPQANYLARLVFPKPTTFFLVEVAPYLRKAPATPLFAQYLARIDRGEKPTSTFLVELNQGLQHDIAYLIRMEHGVQTPELTLQN